MSVVNWCVQGGASIAAVVTTGTAVGSVAVVNNGATGTKDGDFYWLTGLKSTGVILATVTITLPQDADITNVAFYGAAGRFLTGSCALQLYYDAAWTTALTIPINTTITSSSAHGEWDGVSKVRMYVSGTYIATLPPYATIGEVYAYGTPTTSGEGDKGVRAEDEDGTLTWAIKELEAADPMRMCIGGIVYGVELVATTDDDASHFRIKTTSDGVKSIKRLV